MIRWILQILKDNALQITLVTFSSLITLCNAYITSRLYPIYQRIDAVTAVQAEINTRDNTQDQQINKLIEAQPGAIQDHQILIDLKDNVSEVKSDVKDIKNYLYTK